MPLTLHYLPFALVTAAAAGLLYLAWRALLRALRPASPDRTGNGIAASPIKVFDNRFLAIRLEELEAEIAKLGAIDADKLDADVGSAQGSVTSSSDWSVSVNRDSSKDPAPKDAAASDAKEDSTKLSQNARDRLAEQINLRYELVGLRMILERSLTDRLWPGTGNPQDARLQAVLGLQVSLDPPAQYAGCAAIVEVTLASPSGNPVSLVALLPQERANNTIFTSNRSAAAAADLKPSLLGLAWRRASASSHLLAEPETIAFQRPRDPGSNAVTIGWQFRPPLGCPSVTPGLRQLFAVIALPERDGSQGGAITASVRTYWRRYKPRAAATDPRWDALPWRLASDERQEDDQTIQVAPTMQTLNALTPRVSGVRTSQLAAGTVLVLVDGANFFNGTTVAIGSKIHRDPASGLLIKSDQHFQVTTTPEELLYGEGWINGRYGRTVKLEIAEPPPAIKTGNWYVSRPAGVGTQWLTLELAYLGGGQLTVAALEPLPEPILSIGDRVMPGPHYLTDNPPSGVQLRTMLPPDCDTETAKMLVTFPFCGSGYENVFGIYEVTPRFRFALTRWQRAGEQTILISTADEQFNDVSAWSVEWGGDRIPLVQGPIPGPVPGPLPSLVRYSGTQIVFTAPAASAGDSDVLVLRYVWEGKTYLYPQAIPPLLARLDPPTLQTEGVEASLKNPTFVKLAGSGLERVARVSFTPPGATPPEAAAPKPLDFTRAPDNKSLTVLIPASDTAGFGKLNVVDVAHGLIGAVDVTVKD